MDMTIEDRNKFITENIAIAGLFADKYLEHGKQKGYTREDLLHEGVLGMVEATERFDPSKGAKLETYTHYWVKKKIFKMAVWQRKVDKDTNHLRIEAKFGDEDGSITIKDTLVDESSLSDNNSKQDDIQRLLDILNTDILSDVEKLCIKLRFFEGKKQREIDEVLRKQNGMEKAHCFYFLKTAETKLKNAFNVA